MTSSLLESRSAEEARHQEEALEDRFAENFAQDESEGDDDEGGSQPKAGRRRRRRRHRRGGAVAAARGDGALAGSGKGSSEDDSGTTPSERQISSTPRNVVTWLDLIGGETQRSPTSAPAPAPVNESRTPKNSAVQDSILKTAAWPRTPQGGPLCMMLMGQPQPDHSLNHPNACGPLPHAACAADSVAQWGCNREWSAWQLPEGGTCASGQEWTPCHSDQLRRWLCGNLHHSDGGSPPPAELERLLLGMSQEVYED
mmetsp:Transcript_21711/g.57391  ORF Transcript_21711/g.57391 Transcript_21711/m.57391 type:complete len:256 (+) Transcript_21711:85-852(+)